jgi:hypothetical protein
MMSNVRDILKGQTLISDVDGIALDWLQGFSKYMESIGYKSLHDKPSFYSMEDIFPTLEKPYKHIMDFQHSDFYKDLTAYQDAKENYAKLHELGVKIVFLSSCGETEHIKNTRLAQLEREFSGKFDDIILLPLNASKLDTLSKFEKGNVFVDDLMAHSIDAAKIGHKSFLKNMSYNVNEEGSGVARVDDLKEILSHYREMTMGKDYRNHLPTI